MALKLLLAALAWGAVAAPAATLRGSLSLLSYQDTFTPVAGVTANGTSVGFCPGGEYESPFADHFSWSAGACLLVASANAGTAEGTGYSAAGQTTFGLVAQPAVWWHPAETNVALGLSVPLVLKTTNWPGAAEKDSAFAVGLALATRLTREPFFVTPRVGFLKSLPRYFWALEFGLTI